MADIGQLADSVRRHSKQPTWPPASRVALARRGRRAPGGVSIAQRAVACEGDAGIGAWSISGVAPIMPPAKRTCLWRPNTGETFAS